MKKPLAGNYVVLNYFPCFHFFSNFCCFSKWYRGVPFFLITCKRIFSSFYAKLDVTCCVLVLTVRGLGSSPGWIIYVLFQKRVRGFHQGFQTRENWWKWWCSYCFRVFGNPDKTRCTSFWNSFLTAPQEKKKMDIFTNMLSASLLLRKIVLLWWFVCEQCDHKVVCSCWCLCFKYSNTRY